MVMVTLSCEWMPCHVMCDMLTGGCALVTFTSNVTEDWVGLYRVGRVMGCSMGGTRMGGREGGREGEGGKMERGRERGKNKQTSCHPIMYGADRHHSTYIQTHPLHDL